MSGGCQGWSPAVLPCLPALATSLLATRASWLDSSMLSPTLPAPALPLIVPAGWPAALKTRLHVPLGAPGTPWELCPLGGLTPTSPRYPPPPRHAPPSPPRPTPPRTQLFPLPRPCRLALENAPGGAGDTLSFASLEAFTTSLATATRLRLLSALAGVAVVLFNFLITLAAGKVGWGAAGVHLGG